MLGRHTDKFVHQGIALKALGATVGYVVPEAYGDSALFPDLVGRTQLDMLIGCIRSTLD